MSGSAINLLSGYVEVVEGRTRRKVKFTGALVLGDSDDEIRKNFKWHQTFIGRKYIEERRRAEELEKNKAVRLISFTVDKQLGRSCA